MADIRINALATTAASTASDDFIAVDGSANGTRKLNAFSPTFGGNLTVSGTGTSSVAGVFKAGTDIVTGDTSAFQVHNNVDDKPMVGFYRGGTLRSVLRLNTDNDFRLLSSDLSTLANLIVGNVGIGTTTPGAQLEIGGTNPEIRLGPVSTSSGAYMSYNTAGNYFSLNAVTQGVGYRKLVFANDGGNVLIGGTIDGGQKLQVSGTIRSGSGSGETLSSGSIDVGADIGIASTQGIVQGGARIVTFTSGNATFAGTVKVANTAEIKGVYTTTTTFDFGTIANNDASSVCTLTMTGVSSSDSIIVSPTDGDNFPQFCTVSAVPSGNSVSVRLYNGSGSSRTVGSRSIRVTAIKF